MSKPYPANVLFLGFRDLIEISCENYRVGLGTQVSGAGRGFTCTGFAHDRRPELCGIKQAAKREPGDLGAQSAPITYCSHIFR